MVVVKFAAMSSAEATTFAVPTTVEVSASDIVDGLDRDAIFKLITEVDEMLADWDFTVQLYEHFAKLKAEYDAEVKAATP